MVRVTRPARGARQGNKIPLAVSQPDGEDNTAPQNVDREAPYVRPQNQQRHVQPVYVSVKPGFQAFADALRQAMTKNQLTASEVARRVWGTHKDSRGYEVARNRDRIGHYLAGHSYPEPDNLIKLADAIGVPVEELQVERPGGPVSRPRLQGGAVSSGILVQTSIPDQPEKVRLQADRIIGWKLAAKIFELLKEAELSEVEAQADAAAELNGFARDLQQAEQQEVA